MLLKNIATENKENEKNKLVINKESFCVRNDTPAKKAINPKNKYKTKGITYVFLLESKKDGIPIEISIINGIISITNVLTSVCL